MTHSRLFFLQIILRTSQCEAKEKHFYFNCKGNTFFFNIFSYVLLFFFFSSVQHTKCVGPYSTVYNIFECPCNTNYWVGFGLFVKIERVEKSKSNLFNFCSIFLFISKFRSIFSSNSLNF
jgi:hypothetical protein